ncbi:sulfurtransferase TusA family protein [Metallumcola ferriviriculae]|uniref:Sulfurtransferase TusA family protein n=1 Tax=Metallumcola ferriviriculae TaxID=3039180 RepID=A0AAU0USA6_9FIRM|nr:sulfurtransferase TusA family protein [Desulfitibacteraceae bacterium MK1]
MKADTTVDAVGLLCPMPIVKLSKGVKAMESGQVLELLADDAGADSDVPAWCKKTGNEFISSEEGDGCKKYYIRKS